MGIPCLFYSWSKTWSQLQLWEMLKDIKRLPGNTSTLLV